jgi:hypothetical protein
VRLFPPLSNNNNNNNNNNSAAASTRGSKRASAGTLSMVSKVREGDPGYKTKGVLEVRLPGREGVTRMRIRKNARPLYARVEAYV